MVLERKWSRLILILMVALCCLAVQLPAFAGDLTAYAFRDFSHQDVSPGSWAVRLNFSAPVFQANLNQALIVTSDERRIAVQITPDGEKGHGRSSRTFLIIPPKVTPAPETIAVKINKGLTDALGTKVLADAFVYEFQSVEQISVKGLETYFRSVKDKGLHFLLSGSAPDKDVLEAIKIKPQVSGMKIKRNDEGQYEVSGDFVKDQAYRLQIIPITTNNGTAIFASNELEFKGPGLTREISFQSDHSIIELRSRQFLPVKLSGISKVRCELKKIPAILIPEVASNLDNSFSGYSENRKSLELQFQGLGNSIRNNYLISADFQDDADAFFAPDAKERPVIFSAPMSFRGSPDKGGAWIVKFSDADKSEISAAVKLIQITDLAISYKLSPGSLLVWITSIHAGRPIEGVNLGAATRDGRTFNIGKTDKDGLILIKDNQKIGGFILNFEGKPVLNTAPVALKDLSWLIAANKDDYCAMEVGSCEVKPNLTKRGKGQDQAEGSRTGYIFTDRGIYRPGDDVNFKFISRIFKSDRIEAPDHAQVKTVITGPRGDVYYSSDQTLNEFGSCYDTFRLETYWPLGNYTIKSVFAGQSADEKGFTHSFSVQEYRESRFFVSLNFTREQKTLPKYVGIKSEEEFLVAEVTGSYFAGGPVRHGRVRWKAELTPVTHSVSGYESYFFGNQEDITLFLESGESVLDEKGRLSIRIPIDSRILTGIYGIKLSATVVDIDGQPATEVKLFNPVPRYLVGIAPHPTRVQVGYSSPLRFMLIDSDGAKVQKAEIEISLLQKRYLNIKKRDSQGNINDNWEEGWIKTFSTKQDISDGKGVFQPELVDPGDYLVSITFLDSSGRYTSRTLFKVGWEDYDEWLKGQKDASHGPNANILVALNQRDYAPDASIEATFHTPRPVRTCLLTLERSEIFAYQVVNVDGKDGGAKFIVNKGYQPNVFVSLLAPVGRTDLPVYTSQTDSDMPAVYSGCANASVQTDLKKLRLEVNKGESELKAKPGEKVTLNLSVQDQPGAGVVSEITICVVNEAVLAMTDFKIPDLSSLGKFDLPLLVKTGDLRLDLVSQDLYKTFTTHPLTGGGAAKALMGPSFRKDFRAVAYFNPAVITDADGKATVSFIAPDSLTTYRVFAVAMDKSSGFVSAERSLLVTKNFYVEPSLPRFLCPGDVALLPFTSFNNTDESGSIILKLNSSKNMTVKPRDEKFDLSKHSSKVVYIEAKLAEQSEQTFLDVSAKFDGNTLKLADAVKKTVPTRGLYTPIRHSIQGNFSNKLQVPVNFPEYVRNMISRAIQKQSVKAYLTLSLNDWSRIMPGFKYLMRYPYGCIEQISSSVIPLVGLRDLISARQIPELSTNAVDDFLKNGVDKILGSQQLTGGFSYWPGQLDTTLWSSTYATFALIKAKKAGMKVPESSLTLASKFLKDSLFKKGASDTSYRPTANRYWTIFALAELNTLTPHDIEPFFSDYGKLSEESKALLLMASKKVNYLAPQKAKDLTRKLAPSQNLSRKSSFDSPWRELAVCLMATLDIEEISQKADELAGKLMMGLRPDGSWISTADTGWCLLALSEYFEKRGKPANQGKSVNIFVDDKEDGPKKLVLNEVGQTIELDPASLLKSGTLAGRSDSIQFVSYCLSLSYPENPSKQATGAGGLSITKTMENLNGKEEIKVGDIVRITLEIGYQDRSKNTRIMEFLALEDFTPAGLTPINTELKTEGLEGETLADDSEAHDRLLEFYPSYLEIRDDGVRVFKNSIYGGLYKFSYLARAVTAGTFWMRGSRISAMYDPDVNASIPGEKVKILEFSR
ncbi:MAG: alpha-2-macroglobulin family protein [Desulfomonilaceae bacterium]